MCMKSKQPENKFSIDSLIIIIINYGVIIMSIYSHVIMIMIIAKHTYAKSMKMLSIG